MKRIVIAILILGIGTTIAATLPPDEPPITVPGDPFEEPPTGDLHCVSQGIVAGRGPLAESNITGDWEWDVRFACDSFDIDVTIDASTIRLLVANAEARS